MSIPFISSCISDDCTDCADMTYDTRVVLKIVQPNNNYKTPADAELTIKNFTLFVFNTDGTLNTLKKVICTNSTNTPDSVTSVRLNISSNASYIYCIANCSDILTTNPISYIATQINNTSNLKSLFDNTLSLDYDKIKDENNYLIQTGYTADIHLAGGSNPYEYEASIHLKPIVSKFKINVSATPASSDYVSCIDSMRVFVLNSHSKVQLFKTNINFPYIHGAFESFWQNADFNIASSSSINSYFSKKMTLGQDSIIYIPENDTTLGTQNKTLVVLKVWFKMVSIDNTVERFCRYFTVQLNPASPSTLSVARGKLYNINFNLSGKYWGALSPLSSMMAPYSPLPSKGKKDLIYVPQEKYSTVKVSNWN